MDSDTIAYLVTMIYWLNQGGLSALLSEPYYIPIFKGSITQKTEPSDEGSVIHSDLSASYKN
jgi:hypothetical protein